MRILGLFSPSSVQVSANVIMYFLEIEKVIVQIPYLCIRRHPMLAITVELAVSNAACVVMIAYFLLEN